MAKASFFAAKASFFVAVACLLVADTSCLLANAILPMMEPSCVVREPIIQNGLVYRRCYVVSTWKVRHPPVHCLTVELGTRLLSCQPHRRPIGLAIARVQYKFRLDASRLFDDRIMAPTVPTGYCCRFPRHRRRTDSKVRCTGGCQWTRIVTRLAGKSGVSSSGEIR